MIYYLIQSMNKEQGFLKTLFCLSRIFEAQNSYWGICKFFKISILLKTLFNVSQ